MSANRRTDDKGRVLRNGESYRRDGRYIFKYFVDGSPMYLQSHRLTRNDPPVEKGGKKEKSLREMEKELERDLFDGIIPGSADMSVLTLVKKYIDVKTGVKDTTKIGYKTVLNILEKEKFCLRHIDEIRTSDAKQWMIKLQRVDGRGYATIHNIRGVLRPAFRMAVEDDLIRKNPFDFMLSSVIVNDSVTREAITRKEERKFLDFVKSDNHFSKYYDGMYILFNTGLRIGEFSGLTIRDIDFSKMCIKVDHQLRYVNGVGLQISTPKTKNGYRRIPMSDEVAECFRRIMTDRPRLKVEPNVDGYSGFLFINEWGNPKASYQWEKYFQHAVDKYNSIYRVQLPKITPHVCRHTFCSKMANSGINPKTLQYIMGHGDISVTMNTYTHVNFEEAEEEMKRVQRHLKAV